MANSIVKSAGSDATLTLSAYRDILVNAPISSTSNKRNLLFEVDNHSNGSGSITIDAPIATNGGNITRGGGAGTISPGNGYAVGDAADNNGMSINGVAINASGGNIIIINGEGYNTTTDRNYGVSITGASAAIETTATAPSP